MTSEPSPEPASSSAREPTKSRRLPWWAEGGVLLVLALVVVLLVKTFLVQAFYVPSDSMEPALASNDRILVQKVSGDLHHAPRRGDVVVFKDPGGWLGADQDAGSSNPISRVMETLGLEPTGGYLVKRVVGIPGDTIRCCDAAGRILVDGRAIEENFLATDAARPCDGPMIGCRWRAGPVPPGTVFVMGDNRLHSEDSTTHLCTAAVTDCTLVPWVSDDLVVGRVWARIWPLGRIGLLHRPAALADLPAAG